MSHIIEKLQQEHGEFRVFLKIFNAQLDKFRRGRSPDYELIDALLDFFTSFPDEWHHQKEDLVYDAVIEKAGPMTDSLVDLRAEHEKLASKVEHFEDRMKRLRRGSDLPMVEIVEAGDMYGRLLRHHMVKEEQVFFPMAQKILSVDDWLQIDTRISQKRENPAQVDKMIRIRSVTDVISEIIAE